MPTTKAHKTRHHSNLRPKHKHSKKYLQSYWPYLPLMMLLLIATVLLQPWQLEPKPQVLPYATSVSSQQLLQETNRRRAAAQAGKLSVNDQLTRAAQAKAQDMAAKNYWSHNTPDGRAPWVFINRAGYEYQKAGENLAYGFDSSSQVVAGWMNSKSHRQNMLDTAYQDVGFGFADNANFDNNGPATIVVAMYGAPEGVEITAQAAGGSGSYNSLGDATVEPAPQAISKVQSLTDGAWPYSPYIVGFLVGAVAMFLVAKHALVIKRVLLEGEEFLIEHPLLDVTLIALIVVGVLISQQIGVIL